MFKVYPVSKESKKSVCCICSASINGWGYDPFPVSRIQTDTCCAKCYPSVIASQALAVLKSPL